MDEPCLFTIRDINIQLLIDWSINWSINGQRKLTEGHISSAADNRTHYLTDISTETWRPLSTETNQKVGRFYIKYQTLIFTYRSINLSIYQYINLSIDKFINLSICQFINLSTDRRKWRREKSVGKQKAVFISRPIYQWNLRYAYQNTQIYGRVPNLLIYQRTEKMYGGTQQ